jgi:hypothetical protein
MAFLYFFYSMKTASKGFQRIKSSNKQYMEYQDIIVIALLVVLILVIIGIAAQPSKQEKFNTYFNQDEGAYDIYSKTGMAGLNNKKPKSVSDAGEYAKYAWNERDRNGLNIYDKYYEVYNSTAASNEADATYARRDVGDAGEENVYDMKFSVLGTTNTVDRKMGVPPNDNLLGVYHWPDMQDRNPALAYDINSDDLQVISQKNY